MDHTTGKELQAGKREPVEIDLTADDDDDDDEPIFVASHTATPTNTAQYVCVGLIFPVVYCMYGLPPELHLRKSLEGASGSKQFWGDPAYGPVTIFVEEKSAVAPRLSTPIALSTTQKSGLLVSTLLTPKGTSPKMLNQYGTLADKFSCVLGRLIQQFSVICISRHRLVSPMAAMAFTQSVETLVFATQGTAVSVVQALAAGKICIFEPPHYDPSEFPGSPPLLDDSVFVKYTREPRMKVVQESPFAAAGVFADGGADKDRMANRARFVPPATSVGGPTASSPASVEAEQQAQIDAVYANLRGGDDLPETEPGPLITTRMYPHQKQAITFLLDREKQRSFDELLVEGEGRAKSVSLWQAGEVRGSVIVQYRNIVTQTTTKKVPRICRGAILADDMGLGKTITTIAMIAKTFDEARAFGESPIKRDDDDEELTIVGDTRNRRTAEQARKEELRCRSRATLLICPLSIISNWESQVKSHWDKKKQPSIYVYHGSSRLRDPHVLANHDLVITTYSTLGFEFSHQTTWTAAAGLDDRDLEPQRKGGKEDAPNTCQYIEWFRIVLDEAHMIKEARTWQSKAVCNLSATRRICLTGTPVQNRIDDLYGLLLFLQMDPFTDRAVWNQFCGDRRHAYLNQPRMRGSEVLDSTQLARVQTIMKFLTLRRLKNERRPDGAPILKLPPKMARVVSLEWDPEDRAKYDKLHSRFREEFVSHMQQGTVGSNYATILHEILILRMMCDHAELIDDSNDAHLGTGQFNDISEVIRKEGLTRRRAAKFFAMFSMFSASCNQCNRDLLLDENHDTSPVVTQCQHLFCARCLPVTDRTASCPYCHTVLSLGKDTVLLHPEDEIRAEGKAKSDKEFTWSTKLHALVRDLLPFSRCNPNSRNYDPNAPVLDHVVPEGGSTDSENGAAQIELRVVDKAVPIKSVVFSQWTRMLAKIGTALENSRINYVRLDGTMSRTQRQASLSQFEEDPGIEVLLVSLRAGGFGLNLVSACRAYLMDPYWNPAVENQGLDRVHRLGQTRPVVTTKFIMQKSIEEKMLALQRYKMELANRVGSRRISDAKQNRNEELKLLFS
ncbi:1-phosphatidylinositol 4-kinase [Malassezia cuniculi]|uniref:1-phosphatidylinositol 4-kinase n=1 Tax=Malassezia cuniculi TaxID=948313 RepID=A0AAF0EP40_9BASI|nr:1-phosphatidylinositol 4-kinase [Malassezia cuniculi]